MHPRTPKKILLAEGNLDTGSMFFHWLTERKHAVTAVTSFVRGVEALCKQRPSDPSFDVLIASQDLDGIDRGNHFVSFVHRQFPHIKIILISGKPRPTNCPADAYIPKLDAARDPELLEEEIQKPKLDRAS